MENQEEYLEFNPQGQGKKVRPTFLLVLCILSWLSVAMNVISSVGNITKGTDALEAEAKEAIFSIKKSIPDEEILDQTIEFFMTNIETNASQNYVYLILFLLQGAVVFMMFQQKKIGFFGYLGIQIGFIGSMIYFYPWPNFFSTIMVGMSSFASLLFIILYAVNLKHMD